MARRERNNPDYDDEIDDDIDQGPDESDLIDGEDPDDDTMPCPHCSRRIYEQSEWCPHCGKYILDDDTPAGPRWVVWTTLAMVILVALSTMAWLMSR